jgi:hypothetical protein
MVITAAAAHLIRDALRRSSIADPVVQLIQAGPARRVPPESAKALLRGDRRAMRELMAEAVSELAQPRHLVPGVYPRSQFPRIFLTKVSGFYFVCWPHMRLAMRTATLDISNGELILMDKRGHVILPRNRAT